MKRISVFAFLASLLLSGLVSVTPSKAISNSNSDKVWRNKIYDSSVKTVLFYQTGTLNSFPIYNMDKGGSLTLTFDNMSNKIMDYQFTIVHCTPGWKASSLMTSDYINGMRTGYVDNYSHSLNTYHDFVHYTLNFPSEYMQPKIPGNYVLKVFKNGNPENLVLTRRFFVVDKKVSITGEVKQATYARYSDYKHEVDFQINYGGFSKISNPFREIKVVIRQNGRWDNAIRGLEPNYVQGKTLIYDHDEKNLFNAGNEFRPFDTRSLDYGGKGVNKLILDSIYHAHLVLDEPRSYKSHVSYDDINGHHIIEAKGVGNPHLEADYVEVNFYLRANTSLGENENIYVFGGLSDWKIQEQLKMHFIPDREIYYTKALLKQGYYDYKYAVADPQGNNINTRQIEGSHYETENDYTIYVYFLSPFLNTYKLIGLKHLNSGVDEN